MKFEITSTPGYNTPRDEYGQHSTELLFALSGYRGTFVWRLSTGLTPLGPCPSMDDFGPICMGVNLSRAMGMGVSAHSELTLATAHEEGYRIHESCEYREGRACVCDYARSSDKEFIVAFACEGIPGVQKELHKLYVEHYGEEP